MALSIQELYDLAVACNGNLKETARKANLSSRGTVWNRLRNAGLLNQLRAQVTNTTPTESENLTVEENRGSTQLNYVGTKITTIEELLESAKIDMQFYEIERVVINNYEVAGSSKNVKELWQTGNKQIKVTLKRKSPDAVDYETLFKDLAQRPAVKSLHPSPFNSANRRVLEISITDPHIGLYCTKGESDADWNLELCRDSCLWAITSLLDLAKPYGVFEKIIFPFGNDFMHHDNLQHTTTNGTLQPEGLPYFQVYDEAAKLAVDMLELLIPNAPVHVIQVGGNHDRVSSHSLGKLLSYCFRRNENITFDVSSSPYKFFHYGKNLIGFNHGNAINPIRLGGIMAKECRDVWGSTTYHEWHLGDQHRKGISRPVIMEELGASIEFLPALTPANAWHKYKGFNWQKRGATAFIWDYDHGPIARLQVNLDSYTGKPMGT
jgi:hypothetical protein